MLRRSTVSEKVIWDRRIERRAPVPGCGTPLA
jgi:hypothetical protein